jgi:preprotein translocase subunit SecB
MAKEKKVKKETKTVSKKEVKQKTLKMSIVGQYLKDLSFENPNAPDIFQSKEEPKIAMDLNVEISKSKVENVYESCLKVRTTLKQGDKVAFVIEVAYAGMVEMVCDDEEAVKSVLLGEVPKLLFPYVRQIVSNVSVQGGYPPLNLAPFNFDSVKNKH